MSSLRSTGGGMYRDGGIGGDDDGGKGGECACRAVHLARRSPAEGGDNEIGGDGDGVVMVRSLSTSASGGRDMECNTPKLGRSGIRVRDVLLQDQ
ncbi:hypothetical protein Tco_0463893 [Tanacetum coccineum]